MQVSWKTLMLLADYGDETARDYISLCANTTLRYTHCVRSYDGRFYITSA